MASILQELTKGPASPAASRCPQMASEEDARNMTFDAMQNMGWSITVLAKIGHVILIR